MAKQKFFSITYSGFYMNNSLRSTKPRIDARCPLNTLERGLVVRTPVGLCTGGPETCLSSGSFRLAETGVGM